MASFPSNPDSSQTTTDSRGFTVIKNHNFFRNRSLYPDNTLGTCALVAMCLLLDYFDEYVDGGFITDSGFKTSAGTTNAMHDYLFHNCMITITQGSLGNFVGVYPMAGYEIQQTMKNYIKKKLSTNLSKRIKHAYGSLFFTHATPRKHINGGYPTLLIMTKYTLQSATKSQTSSTPHTVLAYGYDNSDRYLVQAGWWPGNNREYRECILSSATIHSYYTINYT